MTDETHKLEQDEADEERTAAVLEPAQPLVRQFGLDVVEGKAERPSWTSGGGRLGIGSHPSNDVVLDERTVSRFHCELDLSPEGPRLRDLGSRNGSLVDGVRVLECFLKDGSVIKLGDAVLRFRFASERVAPAVSAERRFGLLVGRSVQMRAAFYLLERAAATDATVLIEGETGTGKDAAAESIHLASRRKEKPFIVVDCGSIPVNLIESELFGHERGAFTGAVSKRIGAFESANGGTIFLDELGELPADLQPKLLRVLEQRTVQPVGGSDRRPIDVRVIAATNRNLKTAVNDGSFRSDLYFRLAVISLRMPPLRERPGDIPLIVEELFKAMNADPKVVKEIVTPEFMGRLQRAAWPGNVRELRNYLEQCLVLLQPPPLSEGDTSPDPTTEWESSQSYAIARRRAIDEFERRYLQWLLERYGGNISHAARTVGMDRKYLHRLRRRHEV